jgi:hypothetical protein
MCQELGEMMHRAEFCDLTLITDTKHIPVHVCVVGEFLRALLIRYTENV